jgi:hypothetical protein
LTFLTVLRLQCFSENGVPLMRHKGIYGSYEIILNPIIKLLSKGNYGFHRSRWQKPKPHSRLDGRKNKDFKRLPPK